MAHRLPGRDTQRFKTWTEVVEPCLEVGIEFDTLTMEADSQHATALALQCDSLTVLQAQSLSGLLSLCAGVVRLGRVFLPKIWDFLMQFPASAFHNHRRHITTGLGDDLIWWNILLPKCNGIHLFDTVQHNDSHFYTDASLQGLGGFYLHLHTRRCYTFLLPIRPPKLSTNHRGSNIPSPCGINTPF
jgi:hypothetical protein